MSYPSISLRFVIICKESGYVEQGWVCSATLCINVYLSIMCWNISFNMWGKTIFMYMFIFLCANEQFLVKVYFLTFLAARYSRNNTSLIIKKIIISTNLPPALTENQWTDIKKTFHISRDDNVCNFHQTFSETLLYMTTSVITDKASQQTVFLTKFWAQPTLSGEDIKFQEYEGDKQCSNTVRSSLFN